MSSDPINAANHIANRTRQLSPNILRLVTALRQHAPDGYPAGGSGDKVRGGTTSDPTLATVIARTTGTGQGSHCADDWNLMLYQLAVLQAALDEIDRLFAQYVRAYADDRDRCAGTIDPTCTNLRDGHPDHHGLCVTCATVACRACWKRAKAQRRSTITGELICETCRSAERRAS